MHKIVQTNTKWCKIVQKSRVVLEEPDGNGAETIRDIAANDCHQP